MPRWFSRRIVPLVLAIAVPALAACTASTASDNASGGPARPAAVPTLTFAAYSTPREVYDAKIIPAFKAMWKDKTGVEPQFFESYTGSTTQAQNVVNGSGADVVALSLAPDVQTIQDAGLITHDWTQAPDKGMVSSSVVVFDVRPGNPKGINDWNDLAQPGLGLLTPDPAQSGGARWNLVSLWGSALRGDVPGINKDDQAGATTLMQNVVGNVHVLRLQRPHLDPELRGRQRRRRDHLRERGEDGGCSRACPTRPCTRRGPILIENPVAVVDKNAEAHCVTDLANAFVDFLHTKEAKGYFTDTGYLRSTDPKLAQKGDPANGYPAIQDLFTVDDLGGWDQLDQTLFSDNGIATQAVANAG